ncbi:MAG: fibrobacter succinogenes major paralogous domain-containing protein [Bacteroidales bacterium]|nr:fibrobacter succinogenes major paralogous domain-containing protein [Bacteroidales bacterium]
MAEIYGYLYSWTAAMRDRADTSSQVQGICPDGWHLPSDDEWCEMTHTLAPNSDCLDNVSYFGGDDYLARQISFPNYWVYDNFTYDGMPGFWNSSNLYFNSSEFSALPTGFYSHGSYFAVGAATYWWTASAYDSQESYCRYIQCNNKGMSRTHEETCHGFAVRCILNK